MSRAVGMAGAKKTEAILEQLAELRRDPTIPTALPFLRQVLRGRSSHAAGAAAEIVGENEIDELTEDLVSAFERFSTNAVKTDPGCAAKTAIVEALYRVGAQQAEIYLAGIRTNQLEPVWGGRTDTAGELRGTSAFGLFRMNHPDALVEVAVLLADREVTTRSLAAQALAYSDDLGAIPVLRLKVVAGDEDPRILTECMGALLKIAPAASLEFVGRILAEGDEERSEAAALALGGSRLEAAFAILAEFVERVADAAPRATALLAIALLKREEAIEYLLRRIAERPSIESREAVEALALYHFDERIRRRVETAVRRRNDRSLNAFFDKTFTVDG